MKSKFFCSRYRIQFLLCMSLSIYVLGAQAGSTASNGDEPERMRIEESWLEAIQKRDLHFLDDLIDERFVDTAPDGHLRNKHDVLTSPVVQNVESEELQDVRVHLHGDTGIVTGVNVIKGKENSYVATVHITDVFQKVNGKWKAIAAQENVSVTQP